ncbi:hypothetical protein [Plantactinospora soyae]|uniref:Uncharacterized protein n=1 Tax=Plantactinospora soyae TaxID=1544732 RepID=A0A927QYC0_9ACTN|nr:hypothetical protein [Plantactinospora soyae]MBE1487697.1 hypothetical protein [Plantactinospora soyae]
MAADSKPLPGSTLPGTKLKFGQEAVITVGVGPGRSLVGLTVTGVERGTAEDLEVVRASVPTVGDRPVGSLYFVKAVLENKDGRHFDSSYSGPLLRGTTESGEDAAALRLAFIEIGLLNCPMGAPPPPEFSTRGGRRDHCQIVFSSPANPVTSVGFQAESGKPDITWE